MFSPIIAPQEFNLESRPFTVFHVILCDVGYLQFSFCIAFPTLSRVFIDYFDPICASSYSDHLYGHPLVPSNIHWPGLDALVVDILDTILAICVAHWHPLHSWCLPNISIPSALHVHLIVTSLACEYVSCVNI